MEFPFLPESRIEAKATRLRADASGAGDGVGLPVDLEAIIFDHLYEKDGLIFRDDVNLGYYEGDKVLGKTIPARGQVFVDRSLKNHPSIGRFRFTVAHELGHWVLHRHLFVKDSLQTTLLPEDSDPSEELASLHRNVFPAPGRGRLPSEEWQANRFAIALLIDPVLLREEFRARFSRPYLMTQDFGCSGTEEGIRAAARRASEHESAGLPSLADRFGLSREAMSIALEGR